MLEMPKLTSLFEFAFPKHRDLSLSMPGIVPIGEILCIGPA